MLTQEIIDKYNNTRISRARNLICHAPTVNLNFEQNGNVTACCYNRSFVLGKYPESSVAEIWQGKEAGELREYIRRNDLSGGCSACQEIISYGNFAGSKARYYDEYASRLGGIKQLLGIKGKIVPKVFEFEISNSCNLECTMCNGYFSSAIRKNREGLPAMKNPYDEAFVEQIAAFIPGLTDAKFLGGEPFLIDLYYKIWDNIIAINPGIKVHITTNATVLHQKARKYLEKLNAGIVISVDSLNRERYELIRKNASYDELRKNIDFFIEYTRNKGTYLSFAVCPIRKNWMDIPELMDFCNENGIYIFFNTVWKPESESLKFLETAKLSEVIGLYESYGLKDSDQVSKSNARMLQDLIHILKAWREELRVVLSIPLKLKMLLLNLEGVEVPSGIGKEILDEIIDNYNDDLEPDPKANHMQMIWKNAGNAGFIEGFYDCLEMAGREIFEGPYRDEYFQKLALMRSISREIDYPAPMCHDIMSAGFIYQVELIHKADPEEIEKFMSSHY